MDAPNVPQPIQIMNLTKSKVCTCEAIRGGYLVSRADCPVHGGTAIASFICERVYRQDGAK